MSGFSRPLQSDDSDSRLRSFDEISSRLYDCVSSECVDNLEALRQKIFLDHPVLYRASVPIARASPVELGVRKQQDVQTPTLSELTLDPLIVDVTNGPAQMTISVTGADDLSGINKVLLWFNRPMVTTGSNLEGVFGGFEDGASSRVIVFPQYFLPGDYLLERVDVEDNARNVRSYERGELDALGVTVGFEVRGVLDDIAPELQSVQLTPSIVDVTGGEAELKLFASGVDNLSGVDRVLIWFDRPMVTTSSNLEGIFGGFQDGESLRKIVIPEFFPPGRYEVERVEIDDVARNRRTYSQPELKSLGAATEFEVQSVVDEQVPRLVAFNISPTVIGGSTRELTISAEGFDDLSGIDQILIWFDRPMVTTGSNLEGIFNGFENGGSSRTIQIPEFFPRGEYQVERVEIDDRARNRRVYSRQELFANGFSVGFSVASPDVLFANGFE